MIYSLMCMWMEVQREEGKGKEETKEAIVIATKNSGGTEEGIS